MTIITLNVEGMSCGNCAKSIETNVGQLAGVEKVQVQLDAKVVEVTVTEEVNQQAVADAIEALGFDVI